MYFTVVAGANAFHEEEEARNARKEAEGMGPEEPRRSNSIDDTEQDKFAGSLSGGKEELIEPRHSAEDGPFKEESQAGPTAESVSACSVHNSMRWSNGAHNPCYPSS